MRLRKLLNWRTALIYLHRWLGITLGVVCLVWFASGIAMIYVGMPGMSTVERLGHMPPLRLDVAHIEPREAAQRNGLDAAIQLIEMSFDGRPVYRFDDGTAVYADTGNKVEGATADQAIAFVRRWLPQHAATVRYDAYLTDSDQWTLGERRGMMPLHRIAVGDPAGTVYYISAVTGEPTMKTDRRSRTLGYVSAVVHWTYFTSLRRNAPLWLRLVGWTALFVAFTSLLGLIVGVFRTRFVGHYRMRAGPSHSPYVGWMKWHHYGGLFFGVTVITWSFSGAMSLDFPIDLHNAPPTPEQRRAVSGTPSPLGVITIDHMRRALQVVGASFAPKRLDVLPFLGHPYFIAERPPQPFVYEQEIGSNDERAQSEPRPEHLIVSALEPERSAFRRFSDDDVWTVARAAMPGVAVKDAAWLGDYDAYYYDQYGRRPLPVLRVRYTDRRGTWLYLDPSLGTMTRLDRGGRWNRWLYHGLHSLDFPFLYRRRPLWDIVVILLSVGGFALSLTSLLPSWRRLRRHARRLVRPGRD